MAKYLHLTIPEPCHEKWDHMSPQDKGRFCNSCQKQVVDFTTMSDQQLRDFFKKQSTGSVCGRFENYQLDRDILLPSKKIPWVKYFFQIALPAFLLSAKAQAQGKVKVTGDTITTIKPLPIRDIRETTPESEWTGTLGMVAMPSKIEKELPLEKVITGKVTDQSGAPIPNAYVFVKGNSDRVLTDGTGNFSLNFKKPKDQVTLIVSYVGYVSQEIRVKLPRQQTSVEISTIVMESQMMGEVVVVGYAIPSRKKSKQIPIIPQLVDTVTRLFKAYPNPVMSGTNIHIEWKGKEEGYFQLNLADQSGRIVHQREIWIDADARLLNFDLPAVPAGHYLLSLANKKTGKIVTEKLLIQ